MTTLTAHIYRCDVLVNLCSRLARQRDQAGWDVRQVSVIKDRNTKVLTREESVLTRWKKYFENVLMKK